MPVRLEPGAPERCRSAGALPDSAGAPERKRAGPDSAGALPVSATPYRSTGYGSLPEIDCTPHRTAPEALPDSAGSAVPDRGRIPPVRQGLRVTSDD